MSKEKNKPFCITTCHYAQALGTLHKHVSAFVCTNRKSDHCNHILSGSHTICGQVVRIFKEDKNA